MVSCQHPDFVSHEAGDLQASKLAELALERHDLGDVRLRLLRRGFVHVYRVESPTEGEFVLRMYNAPPAGSNAGAGTVRRLRSPDTLRSQLAWLLTLGRETDLLVPEPVPMSDGSLMDYVSPGKRSLRHKLLGLVLRRYRDAPRTQSFGRYSVLLRWVPGDHKGDDLTLADLSLFGSYVARLHGHTERYEAPEGTVLPRWDYEWPFGEAVPLWREGEAHYSAREMEVFRAAARRVREDLDRLGEGREEFGLIHRDLKLANVVFDGERVGAIDFDLCGWGYYLFDLSVIRRSLRILTRQRTDLIRPLWEAFLEGYRRERPLREDYERYLITSDVMQSVAAVNRQIVLLRSGTTAGQARHPGFLKNVSSWLEDLMRRE